MDKLRYVIQHYYNWELYWSNDIGWADRSCADVFTQEERDRLNLPIDGVWVRLW